MEDPACCVDTAYRKTLIICRVKWPVLQVDLRHHITGQQREQPAVDGDEHLVTVRHNKEDRHPDDDAGERPEHRLGCGMGGLRLWQACRRRQGSCVLQEYAPTSRSCGLTVMQDTSPVQGSACGSVLLVQIGQFILGQQALNAPPVTAFVEAQG